MPRRTPIFIALLLAALTAHALFSPLGYNPTDDGFTLAYSRRLLDGQVPHRDFISIRPVLSPLLHAPLVALAGDHLYLASRLVFWLQISAVAGLWVAILARLTGATLGPLAAPALALAAFAATAHTFPALAWHTIDGLLLASLGIWLALRERWRLLGYALLGAAVLCKQSFALLPLGALLILGDWRDWRCWLAAGLPGAAYVAALLAWGALPDALLQLRTQTGLYAVGVVPYLVPAPLLGIGVGIAGRRLTALPAVVAAALLALVLLGDAPLFGVDRILFGLVAGSTLAAWRDTGRRRAGLVVLLVAWSASLSVGYATPALALGSMLALLLLDAAQAAPPRAAGLLPVAVALVLLPACGYARTTTIYRDAPARELTAELAGVLPGGAGLRTNPRTAAFLADLRAVAASAEAQGLRYAVLPDAAGWWAAAAQPNPLPIDWPQPIELATPALRGRVIAALDAQRGEILVAVQRGEGYALATGGAAGLDPNPVVAHVEQRWHLVGETAHFRLYR
jgi:hypothetical protein